MTLAATTVCASGPTNLHLLDLLAGPGCPRKLIVPITRDFCATALQYGRKSTGERQAVGRNTFFVDDVALDIEAHTKGGSWESYSWLNKTARFFLLGSSPTSIYVIYEILLAQMGVTSVLIWVTLLFAASIHAVPDFRGPGDFDFGIRARPTGRRHAGFHPTGHSRPHLFLTTPAHPHPVGPSHRPPGPGHGSNTVSSQNPVYYSGPPIIGTASLPASLSTIVFPSNLPTSGFPKPTSGSSLGNNALPQSETNGQSLLGTFDAPKYPLWIGHSSSGDHNHGGSPSGSPPWGNRTASNTNPYKGAPSTGVVRSYDFVISRGTIAPDGVERSVLLVNGAFPGPTIEANWGDTIQVTVTNSITGPEEGTALHWHGMLQKGTPYEDGVPGITQCPIAPGQTFTYSFNAALYGTTWYHSHYSAQYAGGILGPMIIHGPLNAEYDEDLGPILLTDYYHEDYYTIVEEVMGTDLTLVAPTSVNNLINGKGVYDCSLVSNDTTCTPNAGLSKFGFTSGQSYRLRLINAGAEGIQRFSIDNHALTVMAYDLVPIEPYTTNVVTLGIGQRADVIVQANGSSSDLVWMRSTISSLCSATTQPDGLAIIYYQDANTTAEPTSSAWPIDDTSCGNDALDTTVPFYPITPPASSNDNSTTSAAAAAAVPTVNVALNFEINSTGHFLWTMDGSSFRVDYNDPVLMLAAAGNDSHPYDPEWNMYDFGSNQSFVIVVNNESPIAHPMHIHGHNMFVLSEGLGTWDGSVVNPSNPTRRDVQMLQPDGYMAIQVDADNPGVWPFHCHIAWHVSGGLYINILEHPELIPSAFHIPSNVNNLCTSWDAFTNRGPIDQIDSGLRKRNHLGNRAFSNPIRRTL
ncbi:oxidoreductase ptaK [Exophiala dermatitidis]